MKPRVSVIIVTRNRAQNLAQTLESILGVRVPEDLPAEVIVVDNGSTDGTAKRVRSLESSSLPVRYLSEPRPGKSNGLNLAMAEAAGDIFLFTDDDIRVPENWVEGMCRPIVDGRADAVVGGVRMAAHLRRSWMEANDFLMLACNEGIDERSANPHLVGANMAIARRVFQIVPGFDPEIGPGASASPVGEDALLSLQIRAAGLRILRVADVVAEHHFDPARLTLAKIRRTIDDGALSDFYIAHHWSHACARRPLYRMMRAWCKLQYRRVRRFGQWRRHEAMAAWERMLLQEIRAHHLHWKHRRLPRNYEKFGLVKLNGTRATSHLPDSHVRAGL